MNLRETYNRIAEDWHRDHRDDDWWVGGTDKLISLLAPGALVLDAGCGAGTKAKYLTERGMKVVGADFSERFIEIARREVPAASFFAMDLADAEKLDYEFDAIFMQAVLLHVRKQEVGSLLSKLSEKLKPGGYFYIAVKERRVGGPDEEIKIEDDYGYPYERFFSYFTADEIKEHMKMLGFGVEYENVSPAGKTRWIQTIGKK